MRGFTRRAFIVSAALSAAAVGLDRRLAVAAWEQPPSTPDPAPGFYRYPVWAAQCTALYDGVWEKPHDPAYFSNASVEQTKAALAEAGLPDRFVQIPISAVVVELGGTLTLCDTGGGGEEQAPDQDSAFRSGR